MSNTPSYAEVERRMEDYVSTKTNRADMRGEVFAWMAEFGLPHYKCMCTILQGFRDQLDEATLTKLVREQGRIIHNMGGLTAMIANYYIYTNFLCDPSTDRAFQTPVKRMWHGVGEWTC
jgi:hypothetical protein